MTTWLWGALAITTASAWVRWMSADRSRTSPWEAVLWAAWCAFCYGMGGLIATAP
jgi:hypothetical protein